MKQIKTIIKRRDYPGEFDSAVNEVLAQGWTLIKRYISNGRMAGAVEPRTFYPVLVAELEKEFTPEQMNREG